MNAGARPIPAVHRLPTPLEAQHRNQAKAKVADKQPLVDKNEWFAGMSRKLNRAWAEHREALAAQNGRRPPPRTEALVAARQPADRSDRPTADDHWVHKIGRAPRRPTGLAVLRELVRAEYAMRYAASQWQHVPAAERLRLIRAADRADLLLVRSGIRETDEVLLPKG